MRVREVSPYAGPQDDDGLVTVYDITVKPANLYTVYNVLVSNSKRISMLDVNALLSHGATETLRDAGAYRGQKNEQMWLQFMMGYTPTQPKVPKTHEQFFNQLKASGINAVRDGYQTQVMALTNKDVRQMAGDRLIKSGDTVHWDKDLRPVAGGLFDPQLTGGHDGRRWAAIQLPEPMPNPVMEEPIRRILGLTQKQFLGVISGDHQLENGSSGPAALGKALENIDLDREITKAKAKWAGGKGQSRDDALRRWRYLADTKRLGMHPKDWIMDRVPVLPPAFRPVSMMGNSGTPLVNDANYLYKELLDSVDNHGRMKAHLGDEDLGAERAAIYHSYKAVTGLADPIHPKLQDKGVKGILKSIFGTSPKFGTVQRKLLSSTVDNVGRATIIPNPDLDMDSVGIPENQAYNVYSKFVVRRLRRRGLSIREALKHVTEKTDLAKSILQEEMEERPVFINRAPVLHKFGIMAFKPKLVTGDVLQISPMIVKGFNADFDGDAMQFHVPTTESAVKEAYERMLPSRSLLSPADFRTPVNVPGQEYLGGLNHATRAHDQKGKRVRVFRNKKDALQAFARNEISAETPIHVMED